MATDLDLSDVEEELPLPEVTNCLLPYFQSSSSHRVAYSSEVSLAARPCPQPDGTDSRRK